MYFYFILLLPIGLLIIAIKNLNAHKKLLGSGRLPDIARTKKNHTIFSLLAALAFLAIVIIALTKK